MSSFCNCGMSCSVDYAMTCNLGFPTIHHNEIRDLTASLLSEVCHNVAIEPHVQPLNSEGFHHKSANTDENSRLDIRARVFWNLGQDAYFDVRVLHPNAPSYCSMDLPAIYHRHEKKRQYSQRVKEVEHGVFTPLVFFYDWRNGS